MIGNAVRIGVMGALALAGSMQVASSIPRCVVTQPQVVALEVQWKVATGDTEGAYKVIRRAEACRKAATPNFNLAHQTQSIRPDSSRSRNQHEFVTGRQA